jgi:WXG100 family type VII secretion target
MCQRVLLQIPGEHEQGEESGTMPPRVIQCNYDSLAEMMISFSREADQTRQLMQTVRQVVNGLQSGGWIGLGAEAFFAEMEHLVFPGVERLSNALSDAGGATKRIAELLRAAEEEAAALFRGGNGAGAGVGGGTGTGVGGAAGGAGGSAPGGAAGGTRTYPQPSWPVNLRDPRQIDSIIRPNIQGANTAELAAVMRFLSRNPTGPALDQALSDLARIRGVPEAQIRADYQRFQELQQQALNSAYGRKNGISPLADGSSLGDSLRAGDSFWGTTDQLRFGQIVGNTFGIDPVFGSMLNPTGGLVGPGDSILHAGLGGQQAVVIHGAVHDAGGFLYNYYGVGPGYHYVPGKLQVLDTSNPLAGQVDGIRFWRDELSRRGN